MSSSSSQVVHLKTRENRGVISKDTAYNDKEYREAVKTEGFSFVALTNQSSRFNWYIAPGLWVIVSVTKQYPKDQS